MCLQVSLRGEEGGGEACELVPGGASEPVTPDNVYQYVKLYAELRMLRSCYDALLVSQTPALSLSHTLPPSPGPEAGSV